MKCDACENEATHKDYRRRHGIVSSYRVCYKHLMVTTKAFFRALDAEIKKEHTLLLKRGSPIG